MAVDVVVEVVEPEGRPEEVLDQAVAFRARRADHRMAESERQLDAHERRARHVGFDVDRLGVDQQAIHVENDGLDGFIEHGFVLSLDPETANIGMTGGRKIHAHP